MLKMGQHMQAVVALEELTHVRRFHPWAREVVLHHFDPTREVNLTIKDDSFWVVLR